MLDHIVLATPDIAATSEWLADLTGVVASEGGPHVNKGTRNRLCSFGDTYLEIIGPDPEQGDPGEPRSFGIDDLTSHRIVTWCARQHDLSTVVAAGAAVGLGYTEPVAMRRVAPDTTLDWHLSLPTGDTEGGILPFFIDWGTSRHPSETAAPGLSVATIQCSPSGDCRGEHTGIRSRSFDDWCNPCSTCRKLLLVQLTKPVVTMRLTNAGKRRIHGDGSQN